jgi:hypothetical protein
MLSSRARTRRAASGEKCPRHEFETAGLPETVLIPFFERLVSWMPIHWAASWAILSELLFFGAFLTTRHFEVDLQYWQFFLFGSLGVYISGVGLIWGSRVLCTFKGELDLFIGTSAADLSDWFRGHVARMFGRNARCAIFAVFWGALFVFVIVLAGRMWPVTLGGRIAFCCFTFASAWVMGFMLASVMPYVAMVRHMARLDTVVSCRMQGIYQVIGRTSLKFTLVGVAIYMAYLMAAFTGLPGLGSSIYLLIAVMALILIGFFVVPQFGVHRMMVATKRRNLFECERRLNKLREEFDENPNGAKAEFLRAMRERYAELEKQPEWPFNMRMVASVVCSVFLPLVFILAQWLLSPDCPLWR